MAADPLDEHAHGRLETALAAGDLVGWVGCSHLAKELLRPDNSVSDSFAGINVLERGYDEASHVDVAERPPVLVAQSTAGAS